MIQKNPYFSSIEDSQPMSGNNVLLVQIKYCLDLLLFIIRVSRRDSVSPGTSEPRLLLKLLLLIKVLTHTLKSNNNIIYATISLKMSRDGWGGKSLNTGWQYIIKISPVQFFLN